MDIFAKKERTQVSILVESKIIETYKKYDVCAVKEIVYLQSQNNKESGLTDGDGGWKGWAGEGKVVKLQVGMVNW